MYFFGMLALCEATMPATRRDVRRSVLSRMKDTTLHSIMTFIKKKKPNLWGLQQPKGFVQDTVLITLYRDMHAIGYHTLMTELRNWVPCSYHSIRHNTQRVRRLLGKWGRKQILLGTKEEWEEAATEVSLGGEVKRTCLWMDSTDFRLVGKSNTSRKHGSWSYKCNSPGRRYMMLCDGRGSLKKMWGGYSPKVYDGNFVEERATWFEKRLKGATVVADQHFEWGKTNLEHVRFHTPISHPKGRPRKGEKKKRGESKLRQLSKKERRYNEQVHSARARVELPFGVMKKKFECLDQPWRESPAQLDRLVYFVAGVMNHEKEGE